MKKMADFDKESFKKDVINNVKNLFRKTIDEATQEQVFQAVSYAVKDHIIDRWIATQKAYEEKNAKTVYYLSMEFLMGRALGNNMINLTCYEQVKEALAELGFDLNVIEDQEPDAALGNGGLGRLAACFLDSLATLNLPLPMPCTPRLITMLPPAIRVAPSTTPLISISPFARIVNPVRTVPGTITFPSYSISPVDASTSAATL